MVEQIKELLDHDPFQPFRIFLTSGQHYDISDPHLIAVAQSQIIYCFPSSDKIAYLRLNQIASCETLHPASS